MKNGVFKFYLFVVCFVALVFAAISLGKGLHNLVTLLAPELTLNSLVYHRHQSVESFRQSLPIAGGYMPQALLALGPAGMPRPFIGAPAINSVGQPSGKEQKVLSHPEVDALRLKSLNSAITHHRHEALKNLINLSITFFIAISVFMVHWRMASKARRHELAELS